MKAYFSLIVFFVSHFTTLLAQSDTNFIIDIDNNAKHVFNLSEIFEVEQIIKLKNYSIASINKISIVNNIFVIFDKKANNIVCFSKEGKFLNTIGNQGKGPKEYIDPLDFAATKSGLLYVLDDTKRILVFELNGTYIKTIKLPAYFSKLEVLKDDNIVLSYPGGDKKLSSYEISIVTNNGEWVTSLLKKNKNKITPNYLLTRSFQNLRNETHFILPFDNTIYSIEHKTVKPYCTIRYKKFLTQKIIESKYKTAGINTISLMELAKENAINFWYYFETGRVIAFSFLEKRKVTSVFYDKKNNNCFKYNHLNLNDPLAIINPIGSFGNKSFVSVMYPYEFLTKETENKIRSLSKTDNKLAKRLQILKRSLNFDDNPVLLITSFKN